MNSSLAFQVNHLGFPFVSVKFFLERAAVLLKGLRISASCETLFPAVTSASAAMDTDRDAEEEVAVAKQSPFAFIEKVRSRVGTSDDNVEGKEFVYLNIIVPNPKVLPRFETSTLRNEEGGWIGRRSQEQPFLFHSESDVGCASSPVILHLYLCPWSETGVLASSPKPTAASRPRRCSTRTTCASCPTTRSTTRTTSRCPPRASHTS